MNIVRNCIDIIGITPENELPKKISGQLIEASQAENLFIEDNIKIKNIYQIIIDIDIKRTKVVNAPMNKIVVVDVNKKFKIAYYDMDGNMGILELSSPYNVFFDLENNNVEVGDINIHIADAYFELVNSRTLYNHMLYIIDVQYFGRVGKKNKAISFNEEIKRNHGEENIIGMDRKDNDIEIIVNKETNKEDKDIPSHTLKEVSISEENKSEVNEAKSSEENQLYIEEVKNEFFDMEDEYL